MDVDQSEAMIAEDTPVVLNAVGEKPKLHAVHLALFSIEAVLVSGCEEKRCTALKGA
jgi:hypothetical protein